MEQFSRKCEWCSIQFETEYETKLYCTREHKHSATQFRSRQRRNLKIKTLHIRICAGCAQQFSTDRANKVYCSEDCRNWTQQQIRAERDKEWEKTKTKSLKQKLFWRDNGLCQICMKAIDLNLKYPDPMSFSIDHIIPRSKGGNHNYSNLRVAHWECNVLRGDRPAT